ncbi:hypothetical protein RclHR1_22730001 [Rhizophagus clarus]|uniref:Protein kinase domain-containing protein n=1 Tax=Rhizophagus clarus TaxID=94130 RepID=A0A2Z6QUK7_9GLOM|nr:hypothetical protein RclHR1_22730001 [Rhizophagus clarus]
MLERRLKWTPYNQFKNVKYVDRGGFGIIYKAIWLKSSEEKEVALKCLNNLNENNLNENLDEFLNESTRIINLHGFTKNPDTLNYMVVMDYANMGNLRGNLAKIIENNWNQRFDLGLCKAATSLKEYGIYGVIPFMVPEVLRGKPYTPASDIYSFSMIMWEFTSGIPPFNDRAHDLQLSISICKGKRPAIIESTPQCYVDLMKKCWSKDPLERPSAEEVRNIIANWIFYPKISDDETSDNKFSYDNISKELKSNIMEFINAPIGNNNLITEFHPQAYYMSRLLDFTSIKVNEILEKIEESECLDCVVNNIKLSDIKTDKN